MSLIQLISESKLTQKDFAKQYEIPLRTLENWITYEKNTNNKNGHECPKYILNLLEIAEKVRKNETL